MIRQVFLVLPQQRILEFERRVDYSSGCDRFRAGPMLVL